jgi:hypothetical protein
VYILLSFVNLCMFGLYRDMILFGGSSCLTCTRLVFMLRKIFAGSCWCIQRGCECEKVSQYTTGKRAYEESRTLRDSYCMEKHFRYVYTERITI